MIFVALFFAVSQLRKSDAAVQSSDQQSVESEKMKRQAASPVGQVATESRNKKTEPSVTNDTHQETSTTSLPVSAPVPAMATVTVLIDPSTGFLAKADCPTKTRMTYAAGNEPHAYCSAHQKPDSSDSKVKTIAKRVVTPTEWIGSGKKKSEGERQ